MQFIYKCEGLRRRDLKEWHHTRRICYQMYIGTPLKEGYTHDGLYEFFPLSDDPSKKELSKQKKKQDKVREKEAYRMIEMQSKFFNQIKAQKANGSTGGIEINT